MLLQVMPDGTGSENDFEHLEQLTDTIKNEELFGYQLKTYFTVYITKTKFNCLNLKTLSSSVVVHVNVAVVQS